MSTYIFKKSSTQVATEGEYIGEFIEATEFCTLKGLEYIIVRFKVWDEGDVQYNDIEQWFPKNKSNNLFDEFIDALGLEEISLDEANKECKNQTFGFRIEDNITETKTYHNVVSFWSLDKEEELEEDDEEDDEEEEEEEEEEEYEFDKDDLPDWNTSPHAKRSAKRRAR